MDPLEELKNDVWGKVAQLNGDELAEICEGLTLTVEESKKGKKSVLYALVMRQLASADVEAMESAKQKELFENVKGAVDNLLQVRQIKTEVTTEVVEGGGEGNSQGNMSIPPATAPSNVSSGSTTVQSSNVVHTQAKGTDGMITSSSSASGNVSSLTQSFARLAGGNGGSNNRTPNYVKLRRDFRIEGTVGEGSKDSLSFASLSYLIERGKQDGYTPQEIMAGCIRATKQSSLRFFLENNAQISLEEFMESLKIHYNGKQSVKLLNEMSKRFQGDEFALEKNENEVQFCMRMFGYCSQIRKMAEEEGQAMDKTLIQKTFYESLATGFKQGVVRLELQKTLRDCQLTDNELLKEVNTVMSKEQEHKEKMAGGKTQVDVKEVDILNGRESNRRESNENVDKGGRNGVEGKSKEGQVFTAITALTTQVTELTKCVKVRDDEMAEMKKQVAKCLTKLGEIVPIQDDDPAKAKKKVTFRRVCPNCEAANKKFCRHCWTCGSADHKISDCPENE